MNNMSLWDRVCKTDPIQVTAITGKQYKGNSPKPFYIVRRLTEEFGPCGIGWGFSILSERMERLTETDVLHVAVVRLWYVMDDKRGELEQIGQTKAVYAKKEGGMLIDEDAPKKSVTDALVKCASYLGFAGDIFAGRWDDSKYVAALKREFAQHLNENPPAIDQVLTELQDAADCGSSLLHAAWVRLKTSPGFPEIWAKHADTLKARAKKVDQAEMASTKGVNE